MKVLYLNTNTPDYLAESLFHGLRTTLGEDCVDVPRYDSMYSPLTDEKRSKLRGNGFTLYGLLPELPQLEEKRSSWKQELNTYDLIVVADIWKMSSLFRKLIREVPYHKVVVLDGSDSPSLFPYSSVFHRIIHQPGSFLIPVHKVKYFKRELVGQGEAYKLEKLLPYALRKNMSVPANARTISFSIPAEKITKVGITSKKKLFNHHIVDAEVAQRNKEAFYSAIGSDKHCFVREEDYYKDLQISRFGITTKRAGWDCMRHYELAANGAVLCFRDLDQKYLMCAPHGLNEANSIIYKNYEDLIVKIDKLSAQDYEKLLENTYRWVNSNTTEKVALKFMYECVNN